MYIYTHLLIKIAEHARTKESSRLLLILLLLLVVLLLLIFVVSILFCEEAREGGALRDAIYIYIYTHTYIYTCMKYTHIHIYRYIHMFMYLCVYLILRGSRRGRSPSRCCRRSRQHHYYPQLIFIHIHQLFRILYT